MDVISEPIAGAIIFTYKNRHSETTNHTVLVYDYGGSKIDVSIVKTEGHKLSSPLLVTPTMVISTLTSSFLELSLINSEGKQALFYYHRHQTRNEIIQIQSFVVKDGKQYDLDVTLSKEELDRYFFENSYMITQPINDVFNISGIKREDITELLLIGGSA